MTTSLKSYYKDLIHIEISVQNYKKAIELINKYKEFEELTLPIIIEYVNALIGLEEFKKALTIINQSLSEKIYSNINDGKVRDQLEIYYKYNFNFLKAKIYNLQGKFDESLLIINDIIKLVPNPGKAYVYQAINLYKLGRYSSCLESVNKAIEFYPKSPVAYDIKARVLYFLNQPNKALITINESINLFPEYDGFHNIKSQILEILGKNEEALNEINLSIKLGDTGNWNYYHKAKILFNLQQYNKALKSINRALKGDPHDMVYVQDKINILVNLDRVDEALELLEKEKAYYPQVEITKAQLFQTKAYNLMQLGQEEESIKLIKSSIEIVPDEEEFYHTYGEILMNFERYENALEQFEKAKKLHFTPIATYIKMGKCLLELGRYEDALENLKAGKNSAKYNVKSMVLTKDDKRLPVDAPQTELIGEAEKYILEVEKKLKEIEKT